MVSEEQTNGKNKGGKYNKWNESSAAAAQDEVESKYEFKCDDCPLRFDSVSQHMDRLVRQSAQGKIKESQALQSHWRDYIRSCKYATPFCPACNVHFAGFMKLCQHVVRRVDFEENTTPLDVKKELDRLVDEVKKQNSAASRMAFNKLDDDAVIPVDSSGHREVLNLIVEFLCGISDDMVSTDYQMELLTQVICSRSQPQWTQLHLKKSDCDTQHAEVNDDIEGVENEDEEKEEKSTKGKSDVSIKDTSSLSLVKKEEKNVSTSSSHCSSKTLFRCLAKGCSKEFFTLKEHIEDVIFPRLKSATSKDMDLVQEGRRNHWAALFGMVSEPDFSNLNLTMCSVCGTHFRSLRCGALNGLLNHLSMVRRTSDDDEGGDESASLKTRTELAAHVELHEWLLEQLVDSAAGRTPHQKVAEAIWTRVVCDQGGSVMDLGECGETREANAIRRKERNQVTKKRKRDILLRKKSGFPKQLTGVDGRRDFSSGSAAPLSKRPRMADVRRTFNAGSAVPAGHLRGVREVATKNGPSLTTTFSSECSLCTTRFNGRTQLLADEALRRHLMDTLFGARVGRTGAQFPPHRYWHQVAPTSRSAYCPPCNTECENLDSLAHHLAVVIDGDNNPLSRSSHIAVARSIVDKFVDHMSGALSVEGLRESMVRFSRSDTQRVGSGASGAGGSSFSQAPRHLRDESRSVMNQRPGFLPRDREFTSGLMADANVAPYRRSDDIMSAAFGGPASDSAEFGRQGGVGERGLENRIADSSSFMNSRNSASSMSFPAAGRGGGNNLGMRNNNMFSEPLRKGNVGAGRGGGGGGWTAIASTAVHRF